jgi:hypothetical protein
MRALWMALTALAFIAQPVAAQHAALETRRLMLSGTGPDDAVPWDFTIDGDRRAGEKATIPVPSNWQQQGFGAYQYGNENPARRKNTGHYSRHFTIPAGWKDQRIRLVFDGVMTDTRVSVNGVPAGPLHQGGFYRFAFDVTKLVKVGGDNIVEVDVSEASADPDTNRAERFSDYWVFGGIFRPVWLEATPMQAIAHTAIDARADGTLTADVTLAAPREVSRVTAQVSDAAGKPVGEPFAVPIPRGGTGRVRLAGQIAAPKLWTAETPHLYDLTLTLYQGDRAVHRTVERFGFRTFEVRAGQGLYLNGQRVLLKGINRHSFRPDTARALTAKDNVDDVRLIRSMNMNAVRMSHYPPDESFLKAADELGLYVIDELSGWQHAHGTEIGRRLVREMIERDVNHPSIILWDNGNEGGWNRELDGDFALYDPQGRKVMHPWELHDGIDTKHYPPFPDVERRLAGPDLFMPTEFLHGLFDGGAGAGLEDYWRAIATSPKGAGGFLWVFADEGIARTDRGGRIDNFASNAPDGVVGARHEKEPSYYTIRDLWSPVQIATPVLDARFDGALTVTNGYDFTPLDQVRFDWKLIRFAKPGAREATPKILGRGSVNGPAVAPHATGTIRVPLPADWRRADALTLSASKGGDALLTWTWPIADAPAAAAGRAMGTPAVSRTADAITLSAGGVTARFDPHTGLLRAVTRGAGSMALGNGPRLVAVHPKSKEEPRWTPTAADDGQVFRPAGPVMANIAEVKLTLNPGDSWSRLTLAVSDGRAWKTVYAGAHGGGDGDRFILPPMTVAAVRVVDPRGSGDRPIKVASVRLGYEPARFPAKPAPPIIVRTGTDRDAATGRAQAWLEAPGAGGLDMVRWTLRADGTLAMDYGYSLTGAVLYHGVTFDAPLAEVGTVRALLEGPSPVWQNRLRGTMLGVHEIAAAGSSTLPAPAHAGYFAGLRWVRLAGRGGDWVVASDTPDYLRLGTRLDDHPMTSVDFPAGDLSFLKAIPAIGSKFIAPEDSGPSGKPAQATGAYRGRLTFAWSRD